MTETTPECSQDLLAEYQACEEHYQTLDSAIWQSAAILLGASFAGLALLSFRSATLSNCVVISAIGSGAVVLLIAWILMWRRHEAAGAILHARMREIERQTRMKKNIYMNLLKGWNDRLRKDDWYRLTPEEQRALGTSYKALPFPSATAMLNTAALLSIAAWLALIALKWSERSFW